MGTVQNTIPDELERYDLFKESKSSVVKLNTLNPEAVFGITSISNHAGANLDQLCRQRDCVSAFTLRH